MAPTKPKRGDDQASQKTAFAACLGFTKAGKRRLPTPLGDEERETVAKKPRQSEDFEASLPYQEALPAAGADSSVRGGTPCAVPRRARKRPAAPSPLSLSHCSTKKRKYARGDESCFSNEAASLRGADAVAEGTRTDGKRNAPKKRSGPSSSGSNSSSVQYIKKVKRSAVTTQRESVPGGEEEADLDLWIVRCRRVFLQELGVPLLEKQEVEAMTAAVCERLGAGSYGSCCRSVDPRTQQQVVVKTFFDNNTAALMTEVENLHRLQMAGVQRLMGVCAEKCQLVTYFAGGTAHAYFKKPISSAAAASVFLQVARTLQALVQKGFTHNDLKSDNVCVSEGSGGPVATVIDFGLATPVGTKRAYEKTSRLKKFPWLAPELLLHTHATSEASDAYSLAYMMEQQLARDAARGRHFQVAAVIRWVKAAKSPDPARRPSLAALVQVLEALCEDATKTQSPPSSATDEKEVCSQEHRSRQQSLELPAKNNTSSTFPSSGHSYEGDVLPQSIKARLLQWCRRHNVPVTRSAVSRRGRRVGSPRRVLSREKAYGRLYVVETDAWKCLVYRHDWQKFPDLRFLKRQVKALRRCRGRGVEELVGVCVEKAAVVTQFPGMPLSDLLGSHALSDQSRADILYRTFRIVESMLSRAHYAHNDIGPESVWVARRGPELQVTLTDFWLAGRVGRPVWQLLGDDPGLYCFLLARHPGLCADVRRGIAARGPDLGPGPGPASEVFSLAVLTHTLLSQGGLYPPRLRRWVHRATRDSPRRRPTLEKGLNILGAMRKQSDDTSRKN